MNYFFKFFVFLFLISCIFDPADKLFGLKVPLFISLWLLFLISKKSVNLRFPKEIVLFSLLFLAIPILSISYYLIFDGTQPYAGFSLFKSFLFISLVFILYDKKMNIIPLLAQILSLLSLSIILVYIVILTNPGLFFLIYEFGYNSGVFHIGERVYSSNLKLWSIFFVTSPMIIIAIAYYFDLAFKSRKFKYYFLLLERLRSINHL